jgi:hypothetical protein
MARLTPALSSKGKATGGRSSPFPGAEALTRMTQPQNHALPAPKDGPMF